MEKDYFSSLCKALCHNFLFQGSAIVSLFLKGTGTATIEINELSFFEGSGMR